MELEPGHLAAATVIVFVAFCFGLYVGHLPVPTLEKAAQFAPLGTAALALFAVIVAVIAVVVQRDTPVPTHTQSQDGCPARGGNTFLPR